MALISRLFGFQGDPIEQLCREAHGRRLAALYTSSLPRTNWLNRYADFAEAAHMCRLENRHAKDLLKGNVIHGALLLLPAIHAGLVNPFDRNTYRQYESERRGGPQPHPGGNSSDVPQSQGPSQSPSEPKSPRLAVDLAQSQSLRVVIPSSEVDMVEVRTTSPRSAHSSPSMSVSSAQPANVPPGVVPSIDWAKMQAG